MCGCSKSATLPVIKSERPNYNNIYDSSYRGFWFNNNFIYYRVSGFYNSLYYCADISKKSLITTTSRFNFLVGKDLDGEISSEIQAFGNHMYFLYIRGDGINELYQYDIESKKYKKILSETKRINSWTVVNDIVVYSTYIDEEYDIDLNSLWYCGFNSDKPIEIAHLTTSFGICGNKIRYTQLEDPEHLKSTSTLYEYDCENAKSKPLYSFVGVAGYYNPYNYTENSIVYASDILYVHDIKEDKLKKYELPEYAEFLSCFEQYAFTCTDTSVYRTDVATGKTELLYDDLEECHLLHAISDDCAIVISYDYSGIRVKAKAYAIYADGRGVHILNL